MIIHGKEISGEINNKIKKEIEKLRRRSRKRPFLFMFSFKEDSDVYVKNIAKTCENLGIVGNAKIIQKPNEKRLIDSINELNVNRNIHGILIHRPLPIPEDNILNSISPEKDVYGVHSSYTYNLLGKKTLGPVTPLAVLKILDKLNIDLKGKHAVIVNRSKFIGRPLAQMLLQRDATVTICHSKTHRLGDYTSQADILITAAGEPSLITSDMVKENSVVIDVAMTLVDNRWKGDVDFDNVKDKVLAITPVPGGVGPVTISMIMENTLKAFKNQLNL